MLIHFQCLFSWIVIPCRFIVFCSIFTLLLLEIQGTLLWLPAGLQVAACLENYSLFTHLQLCPQRKERMVNLQSDLQATVCFKKYQSHVYMQNMNININKILFRIYYTCRYEENMLKYIIYCEYIYWLLKALKRSAYFGSHCLIPLVSALVFIATFLRMRRICTKTKCIFKVPWADHAINPNILADKMLLQAPHGIFHCTNKNCLHVMK